MKNKSRSTVPANSLTQVSRQQSNRFATAFGDAIAAQSPACLLTMGFEAAAQRIEGRLPRFVGAALIAANIKTSARQFNGLVAVLQMLVKADAEDLTTPEPKPTPELVPWD